MRKFSTILGIFRFCCTQFSLRSHFQPREVPGNEGRGLTDLAKRDELASGTVLWVVSVKKKKKK